MTTTSNDPLSAALEAIDALHALDPTQTPDGTPNELHYARKMTAWLHRHTPSPSPVLQLAIRAQHLQRWEVPRSTYPEGKAGYFAWRTGLGRRQAEIAERVCVDSGIAPEEAQRVGALIRKEGLRAADEDAEVRAVEDVACLVFLEEQLEGFEAGVEEEKMVGILRKTWGKMSGRGRELALNEWGLNLRGGRILKDEEKRGLFFGNV
ncbi:DUF4202 domain-containing protein [Aspergillus saccharolyticus JOP 1030-1]|uniref:Glutamyl-tRNA synthetase n=1 Tax=Aspergillus saccharolyticus JOP 1030-1 TaxID=1450539 RepID=A0A318Z6Q2_9EURO|nr:hypothetical protein BP01DRAFT_425802 [Aspergillus saccharolyticus JOP 1030-1]PYH42087.1 hypothetical protein BP01DRAFT_425802 [Aspergillus saccharolyticus JOP 1030-1]